jgi:hypothetical protein
MSRVGPHQAPAVAAGDHRVRSSRLSTQHHRRGRLGCWSDQLPHGSPAIAILVRQLPGDALAQDVKVTHQLGQSPGGTHGRVLSASGFEQGENFKLLGVGQPLGFADHHFPLWAGSRA